MRLSFVTAALLPVAILANSSSLEIRADNAAKILADLKVITSDTTTLKADLDKFADSAKPSTAQVLAVNNAGSKLMKEIQAATSEAKGSSPFSLAESKEIFTYINGTTKPAIITLLQDFIAHEPGFEMGGFASLVKSALEKQKTAVVQLLTAIATVSVPPYKKMLEMIAHTIAIEFNKAIDAYS